MYIQSAQKCGSKFFDWSRKMTLFYRPFLCMTTLLSKLSRIVKRKTFKFKFYWKCSNWPPLCSMHNWTLRATSRQILVHKSGVKFVRKTFLTYSFEKIQKLNVARLNKFGFSKVPSFDTLCKSCYHISGRSVFIFYFHSRNILLISNFI
jgi:hypothetical protein